MAEKTVRNTQDLIFRLLQQDFSTIPVNKLKEVIDYVVNTPEELLEQEVLRKRIAKVFSQQIVNIPQDRKEIVIDFLLKINIIDARANFYSYVKLVASVVMPNTFRDGRHIQVICEHLQSLYESYVKYEEDPKAHITERLQVFLPPRSMKSVLCSILFPSWILGRNPKYRVLLIGNNTQNAIDIFGRPLKNLMLSGEYKEIFPETKIDEKASAAQRFFTLNGGGFYCSGAGVAIAGRGGDFIICDDMLSEQTAFSKTERTKINLNYIPGIRSRSQPGAAELLVNTRWHLDDTSGFLLKIDAKSRRPWKVISIPALLDAAAVKALRRKGDPEGWYVEGDSYWPEYKPLVELLDLKEGYLKSEPYKWNALYMQNPIAEEGNIVKAKDFKILRNNEEMPSIVQVIVSLDMAFSDKKRADFTAFSVWGVFHRRVDTINGVQYIPCILLLYAERGKWSFHDLCEVCEDLRADENFKPDFFIVEKAAGSVTLTQELHRRGFPLIEYDARGKKEERLQSAAVLIKAGRVWLPEDEEGDKLTDWAEDLKEETCNFPSSPHDDLMDTLSMAIVWLRDNGIIRHEGYDYGDEEDNDNKVQRKVPNTYWGSLLKSR